MPSFAKARRRTSSPDPPLLFPTRSVSTVSQPTRPFYDDRDFKRIEVDTSSAIMPQPGPQTEFLSTPADVAIYGGSAGGGKSWGLLAEGLRYMDDPFFGGVIFRRTFPEITNEGGLWDESETMYPLVGARPRQSDLEWIFESGAKMSFAHMQYEHSKLLYQGAQIPYLGFDELTHFLESQFFYMLSRNRPGPGCYVRPYVRATTNPDAGSWVKRFLAPWLDKEYDGPGGQAKSAELRWMVRINDRIYWDVSREALLARFPEEDPISVTFIRATVYDNKILLQKDPKYLASLKAMSYLDRRRLLDGDWDIVASGNMFRYEWFGEPLASPPERRIRWCRYWDLAASEVKPGKDPDWTVGCLLGVDDFGTYYMGDMQLLRGTPKAVEDLVVETAKQDYRVFGRIPIGMEQEPGASGITVTDHYANEVLKNYDFKGYRSTGNKIERAKPISALCEKGRLKVIDGPWVNKVLSFFVAFPRTGVKDDPVDGCSGAHMLLNEPPDVACAVDPLDRMAGIKFARDL